MSKISTLGSILNGASIPKTQGDIPAFGGNGVIGYVDRYNYPKNTIIIGRVGANCGAVHFSEDNCWVTDNALAFVVNEPNDPYYIYYLLKQLCLNRFHIGSSQPLITQSIINNIECPNISESNIQNKIGKILFTLDKKIQNNNKQIQTLESLAKTIYDYWFVQFDFPNEDGKPYKSSGGKMVWNEELKREIPEGWGVTLLGEITNCLDSKRIPLSGKERENMKGDIPYYGATCVMDYVNKFIFDGDFVLMAEDGSIMTQNNTPILQRITGKVWVNNHAHILEPKSRYSCALLMQLLKDIYVPALKTGSIQAKITQDKMKAIKIVDIPNNQLQKINKILSHIERKVLHLKKEVKNFNSLKDFLLPLLMNGQVYIA